MSNINKTNVGNPNKHGQKFLDMQYTSGNDWVNRIIKKSLLHNNTDADITLEMQEREMLYITNFYVFSDPEFQKAWKWIAKEFYLFGTVGIQNINGDILVYNIAASSENLKHEIVEATGKIFAMNDEKTIELTNKNAVLQRGSIWGKPWFLFSQQYVDRHIMGLRLLESNLVNSQTTRMIQVNRATSERNAEIKSKYYSGEPFVMIQGQIEKVEDIGLDNQSEVLWKNIKENIAIWEKYRGIRHNISRKDAERNTVDELENDDVQFEFLELERLSIINDMLDKYNKLYGTNITCETLIQQKERESQEQMKENEKNDDNGDSNNNSDSN